MISATWMTDADRNTEYLECRNEEFGNEPRENRTDTVKVYFHTKFDIDTAKGLKLEMPIAKAIFSNREKYGSVLNAWLEMYPSTTFFMTSTVVPLIPEREGPLKVMGSEINGPVIYDDLGGKE